VSDSQPIRETIVDYITGSEKSFTGAEANRQAMEKVLVETKGYAPSDVEVDTPIVLEMDDGPYASTLDLVVNVAGHRFMVIKCAPGSLSSREREVIAAARLLDRCQIPLAVATDGVTAQVWDTVSGRHIGEGLEAVPSKARAEKMFDPGATVCLDDKRRHRTQLVFRSYDSMNVNR
jgi:hypothetical protein